MRHLILSSFLLFFSVPTWAEKISIEKTKLFNLEIVAQDRLTRDKEAKNTFMKLHFFAEGRGMHMIPQLIEFYEWFSKIPGGNETLTKMLRNSWGINVHKGKYVGLFSADYKGMKVGVMGCVVCHSGKAAGQFVPGLGNKNIDVMKLTESALNIQTKYKKVFKFTPKSKDYLEVEESALSFARKLSKPEISNLTQGLVTVSFIRQWFYDQAEKTLPESTTRGAVKVPALWGYGEKRPVGQFSDGFGDGTFAGWAVAVELTAGQKPEVVRSYYPKVEKAEELFSDFLPPVYPYPINQKRAESGKTLFQQTCQSCHGSYSKDAQNLPIYEAPKWIPIEVVKTDDDRIKSNTEEFFGLVENSPLNDLIKINHKEKGYFAPRLVGIWSRFPYLHNASVPTLMDLLSKPENRPEVFDLYRSGEVDRFDLVRVGLTKTKKDLLKKAEKGQRDIYWVKRIGQSNGGHLFGTDLTYDQKIHLLEYLKTL